MSNPSVEGNITLEDGNTLIVPKRSEILSMTQRCCTQSSSLNFTNGYNFSVLSITSCVTRRAQRGRAFKYITLMDLLNEKEGFYFFKFYPKESG